MAKGAFNSHETKVMDGRSLVSTCHEELMCKGKVRSRRHINIHISDWYKKFMILMQMHQKFLLTMRLMRVKYVQVVFQRRRSMWWWWWCL